MRNKKRYSHIIPTAAILLSSVCICSCGTSKKSMKPEEEKQTTTDSIKEFVPLHPPVVVPHTWKEAK